MRKPKTNNIGSGGKVSARAAAMDTSRLQSGSTVSPQADLWGGRRGSLPSRLPSPGCTGAADRSWGSGWPV